MSLAQFLYGVHDFIEAAILAHLVCRKVGVAARPIPVTWDGLTTTHDVSARETMSLK